MYGRMGVCCLDLFIISIVVEGEGANIMTDLLH